MSFTERLKSWSEIIKNVVIIAGILLAVIFAGLSIWANVSENKVENLPDPPTVEKAQYKFILASYETIYTDSYIITGDGQYLLHWYYAQSGDKYRLYKVELPLNKKYCGGIDIIDRAKLVTPP